MHSEEFERVVKRALARLPESIKASLENVAFVVEARASRARKREFEETRGSVLLGLYEGVARPMRAEGYSGTLPDRITIFREPIEAMSGGDGKKLERMVYEVVAHEVGHYLGLDEEALRRLEARKRKRSVGKTQQKYS